MLDTDIDYDRIIGVKDERLASLGAQIRDSIDVDVLHVDHRKLVVIDRDVAYVGGANIGAQYLFHDAAHVFTNAPDGQANAIRELYVRLLG